MTLNGSLRDVALKNCSCRTAMDRINKPDFAKIQKYEFKNDIRYSFFI